MTAATVLSLWTLPAVTNQAATPALAIKVKGRAILEINTSNIPFYVETGQKDKYWYQECRKVFVEIFGEERVPLICKLFAATSINTSLKSNVTLFRKALWEIEHSKPIGNYLPNIRTQLAYIREGKELSGRKISNFARAMAGDPMAVVVDMWLMRAFGMDRSTVHNGRLKINSPTDKQYSIIQDWVTSESLAMHLEPRELSAMIWAGIRITRSGDRQTHYKHLLRYHLTNMFNVL